MSLRMAAFAAFLAALPLSVDAPADSARARGQTRFEAAGGRGQYGIVTRGCNGEILDVVHRQLRSGALAIEHETGDGIVIGVRGGQVRESQDARTTYDPYGGGSTTLPGASLTNRYVNPFVGFEREAVGIGGGWLRADHAFASGGERRTRMDVSGHVRFGSRDDASVAIRVMEDVPLQTFGNVTVEALLHPAPVLEIGPVLGFYGPYDGATFGVKGRVWFTPEAAAQVRACFGGVEQYGVSVGLTARWPARERERARPGPPPVEP